MVTEHLNRADGSGQADGPAHFHEPFKFCDSRFTFRTQMTLWINLQLNASYLCLAYSHCHASTILRLILCLLFGCVCWNCCHSKHLRNNESLKKCDQLNEKTVYIFFFTALFSSQNTIIVQNITPTQKL